MAKKIEDIEGVGPKTGQAFRNAGIRTVDQLLEVACNKKGRRLLSEKTEISEAKVLKCVNMADLFRINGVASQYAELLEGAGVDTVKELRNRNAENLAAKMVGINAEQKIVRKPPSAKIVASWIEQAKALPPKISH